MPLDDLDDADYPAYTTGQAADLLRPQRSDGGHRRYSRRQLELAGRIRVLFDEGHTLAATARIIGLQDELAAAQDKITELRRRLDQA